MLTIWQELALAIRLMLRDYRAGELTLLIAALVIAVGSLATVEFFTDRVQQALAQQSNQLLGADLTVASDREFDGQLEREARNRGLAVTNALRFPSMVMSGDDNLLADVKAVAEGYPLRGQVLLADQLLGPQRVAQGAPPPGAAWVADRILTQFNLKEGDVIKVGEAKLRVAGLIVQEPDSDIGFLNSAPRLIMNEADLAASGLIQNSSRIRYRLYVAGDAAAVDAYRDWAQSHVERGQRIEGIRDARPEIRSALERAEKFLGLAALVSVVLSAVAIALAARRFLLRHIDGCAIMRCLGTRQAVIVRLYLVHFLVLGIIASALGCLLGFAAQSALAAWLGKIVAVTLPLPSMMPVWHGLASGIVLLLGFSLPPLLTLAQVPTLHVLRREIGIPRGAGALGYMLGLVLIGALVLWKASDLSLGLYVLGGFFGVAIGATLLVLGALKALGRLRTNGSVSWRYGIANLQRRSLGNTIQIVALGLGMMALLTLTLIRGDLLRSWQATLKPDTPNRFLINIQSDQVEPLKAFFSAHGITPPPLYPMVRARLVAVNDRPIAAGDYPDDRARRLVDRETNLSWASTPPTDNQILKGRWWPADGSGPAELSVESGMATTLGLKVGDKLTYDAAGSRFDATLANLRKVDWDSFKVNFFVIGQPALLQQYPASFITAFYVPQGQATTLNALVREFPNVVMIDVAQIMSQVQNMMDQVSNAIQFVFLFTVAAGLVVLYAALASTRDEREYEAAIMRTLGASRKQIAATQFAEFTLVGALAGLLAAAGASALGYALAFKVLNVPYLADPWIWPLAIASGACGIALAGMLGIRRVLAVPPMQSLRHVA